VQRIRCVVILAYLVVAAIAGPLQGRAAPPHTANGCANPLAYQVLLDRRGFSPGEIDGTLGENAVRALTLFQQTHNLAPTGHPDCRTWRALAGNRTAASTTRYRITADDARGPFNAEIPGDLIEQAQLPGLYYRSLLELLAERFHAAPELLTRLNHRVRIAAGQTIIVPNVTPFAPLRKAPTGTARRDVSVEVSRSESTLRVLHADGTLAFSAPVSSGSEHDPLPIGRWHVTGISWLPTFHYNPALFWDADAANAKATIKPGPNGPVGVVWVDINVPHYGMHGTAEPALIGHAQSHGCVRLTNWDAVRLASIVRVGTPVLFKE
jgi:lipoprotein-anchoring transpeptidase ErfK/SrfK